MTPQDWQVERYGQSAIFLISHSSNHVFYLLVYFYFVLFCFFLELLQIQPNFVNIFRYELPIYCFFAMLILQVTSSFLDRLLMELFQQENVQLVWNNDKTLAKNNDKTSCVCWSGWLVIEHGSVLLLTSDRALTHHKKPNQRKKKSNSKKKTEKFLYRYCIHDIIKTIIFIWVSLKFVYTPRKYYLWGQLCNDSKFICPVPIIYVWSNNYTLFIKN